MSIVTEKSRSGAIRHWKFLRVALAILLLATAGLKFAGLTVSGVPRVGWFASSVVQMAAAEWELVIGAWLLSGLYQTGSWLVASVTFSVFACVSGYLGWIGVATCGCFGTINVNPWWAFGLDISALLLLGVLRPDLRKATESISWNFRKHFRVAAAFVIAVAGLFAIIVVTGRLAYGSVDAALARLRGDALSIEPSYLDFGEGKIGEPLTAELTVQNWTNHPVRLVGGTSDCSCVAIFDLPVTIGPNESRVITIGLRVKNSNAGTYTRIVWLHTDCEARQLVQFLAGCRVKD